MPDLGNSLSDYDFYRNDRVQEQQRQATQQAKLEGHTQSISDSGVAYYRLHQKDTNEVIFWVLGLVFLVLGAKHIYRMLKPAFDYMFRVFSGAAIVVKSKADGLAKLADENKSDQKS